MAKKMYYTEAEAAQMLGKTPAQLQTLVRDDKLRVFMDGGRKMFRAAEVEAMAPAGAAAAAAPADEDEGDIKLSAGDSGDHVKITEPASSAPTKEDTVITAEGISIFDDEELEVEAADPMAKTQIAPSLEDQVSPEGVGSGSGLLDLTRESDDTSLGAEVLDNIGSEGSVANIGVDSSAGAESPVAAQPAALAEFVAPAVVEEADPSAGTFYGMIVSGALVMLAVWMAAVAAAAGAIPVYVSVMKEYLASIVLAFIVIIIVGAVMGMMSGKAAAQRQAALRRAGS